MLYSEFKEEKLKKFELLTEEDLGGIKKINLFYNANDDSKLLIVDLVELLKEKGLKIIAYTSGFTGFTIITLYVVDKDYIKPARQKDVDYLLRSGEFVNQKSIGKNSEQYLILQYFVNAIKYL